MRQQHAPAAVALVAQLVKIRSDFFLVVAVFKAPLLPLVPVVAHHFSACNAAHGNQVDAGHAL